MFDMRWDWFLANVLDEFAKLHRQSFFALHDNDVNSTIPTDHRRDTTYLLLANERTPKHTDALTNHTNIQLQLISEPIHDLFQCGIVLELESIPKCPIFSTVFAFLRRDWFRETEER